MIRVVHPGSLIRILIFYPIRIQGPKRHRIPDPDPQHCPGSALVGVIAQYSGDFLHLLCPFYKQRFRTPLFGYRSGSGLFIGMPIQILIVDTDPVYNRRWCKEIRSLVVQIIPMPAWKFKDYKQNDVIWQTIANIFFFDRYEIFYYLFLYGKETRFRYSGVRKNEADLSWSGSSTLANLPPLQYICTPFFICLSLR